MVFVMGGSGWLLGPLYPQVGFTSTHLWIIYREIKPGQCRAFGVMVLDPNYVWGEKTEPSLELWVGVAHLLNGIHEIGERC